MADPRTRVVVSDANILRVSLNLRELATYAELRVSMGSGEASCLAIAETRGYCLASDERRAFLREVKARLGEGRLLTTPGLFVLAIRTGLLSIEEADEAKRILETRRFKMPFASFADVATASRPLG